MSTASLHRSIDRPALVNTVLGRVYGVSRSGFLRAGQGLGELGAAEWSRILGAFQRSTPVRLDSRKEPASSVASLPALAADASDPVSATLLLEVRGVRSALAPALRLVRAQGCFEGACPDEVLALVDMAELSIASLERAIAEDASPGDLRDDIDKASTLLRKLHRKVSGATANAETARIGLRSGRSRLQALAGLIGKRWMVAPVAASLQTVEQCARCIEEGIADVYETARDLGLGDCDMERTLLPESQDSLASMLTALARAWTLVAQLAGLEGAGVLREIRRNAKACSERLDAQLRDISRDLLAQEFGLAAEDAERLRRMLARLSRRAQQCWQDLGQLHASTAVARAGTPADRPAAAANLRATAPQVSAVRPSKGKSTKSGHAKQRDPAAHLPAAPAADPPSAETEPMQELDRDP